ncbi:helix-turn-helix transcriptional regulator [Xanthobacter sp. V3C-3]|uniref:helix-turn-helix domain-containing protein n=1 Tax=Xanthobacter lutulentifluminis TaxID=3119935 RepID=UPI00372C447E
MPAQIIVTPKGERLVVIPEDEFKAILEAAEDAADVEAIRRFREKFAAGEEEFLPATMVGRIIDGENKVRVWREHRGLTGKQLAEAAGTAPATLSQIEKGVRTGSVEMLRKIATALRVDLDDVV